MLTIAILAGGRSNRIGRDKAFIPFVGETLIKRILDRLANMAAEVFLIALESDELLELGMILPPDIIPGQGTLDGLYTALFAAPQPVVA